MGNGRWAMGDGRWAGHAVTLRGRDFGLLPRFFFRTHTSARQNTGDGGSEFEFDVVS
ncbi:MAG: hypothetical protein QM736_22995 [Vicinamibacterales bacterium]